MKRLILLSMMLVGSIVYSEDASSKSMSSDQSSTHESSSGSSHDEVSVSVSNLHQINLDNVSIDSGGNWFNKRIWYERAQSVFDEIRLLISRTHDLNIQFTNESNVVERKIDNFYIEVIATTFSEVDLSKAGIDDKFREMIIALETEQKFMGDLSEEERNLLTSLKQSLPAVEQVSKDIKSIGAVDGKISDTMRQAFKVIDECHDFETKAWNAFKSIAKELDDKKARNLYYQMNNYKENIDQKNNYLQSTLLPYLHNVLVARIDMNISKINTAIEDLKKKGIDLEQIMNKTREDDIEQIKEREKAAADLAVQKALEEQQLKDQAEQEKLQKDLEEAQKNSFSSVVHAYYEASIGKVFNFFHMVSQYVGLSIIIGYAHDFARYVITLFSYIKVYAYRTFGVHIDEKKESVAAESLGDAVEKVEEKEVSQEVTTDNQENNVVKNNDDAPLQHEEVSENHEDQKVESQDVKHDDVVVQSLDKDLHDESEIFTSSAYKVFKSILDMIGTLFLSLYRIVAQLIQVLLSIIVYVSDFK